MSVLDTLTGAVTDVRRPTQSQQSSGSRPTEEASNTCATCQKTESLKKCAKCHSITYCSRDCQKAHWKTHKRDCAKLATANAATQPAPQSARARNATSPVDPILDSFSNSVLLGIPKPEVYRRVIDSYRMRVEDLCKFEGELTGLYNQQDPLPEFRKFLSLCEEHAKDMLPEWWNAEAREECVKLATDRTGGTYLGHAVEKSDIQEKYKDGIMPLKLRILAHKAYGRAIGAPR